MGPRGGRIGVPVVIESWLPQVSSVSNSINLVKLVSVLESPYLLCEYFPHANITVNKGQPTKCDVCMVHLSRNNLVEVSVLICFY